MGASIFMGLFKLKRYEGIDIMYCIFIAMKCFTVVRVLASDHCRFDHR